MRVEEIIKSVEEGVNDPHIFKAVFMAGGSGSASLFAKKKKNVERNRVKDGKLR